MSNGCCKISGNSLCRPFPPCCLQNPCSSSPMVCCTPPVNYRCTPSMSSIQCCPLPRCPPRSTKVVYVQSCPPRSVCCPTPCSPKVEVTCFPPPCPPPPSPICLHVWTKCNPCVPCVSLTTISDSPCKPLCLTCPPVRECP